MAIDADGNLYGTTTAGGANSDGTVFEVAHGSNAITTLASFNGANGSNPQSGVAVDLSGNIFGTAIGGGANSDGTVFEVAAGSNAITVLSSFSKTNGDFTNCGTVLLDAAGNLYGNTENGGATAYGSIYEVAAGSNAITTLASFNGNNGYLPDGQMAFDSSGNLYGTTYSESYGTVFELPSGSGTITTVASLSYADGGNPRGGVILDAAGDIYGTTVAGGTADDGTAFEIASGTTNVTVLASFSGTSGESPYGTLTTDASGNFYGTTIAGGAASNGTVFKMANGSNAITAVASFDALGSSQPYGGAVLDAAGDQFGTTAQGGPANDGTIYEIPKGAATLTTIASFNGADGNSPYAAMTLDGSRDLFGTTDGGGANGYGTVFEIASGSSVITTIASFNGPNGQNPYGAVVFDASGNLFGTTYGGGAAGYGEVFEIASGSTAITVVVPCNRTNGASPQGALTLDQSDDLYGTSVTGGANNCGTVFEIARGSNTITTLASFNITINGRFPAGTLAIDRKGDLYGTIQGGVTAAGGPGPYQYGTIFGSQRDRLLSPRWRHLMDRIGPLLAEA